MAEMNIMATSQTLRWRTEVKSLSEVYGSLSKPHVNCWRSARGSPWKRKPAKACFWSRPHSDHESRWLWPHVPKRSLTLMVGYRSRLPRLHQSAHLGISPTTRRYAFNSSVPPSQNPSATVTRSAAKNPRLLKEKRKKEFFLGGEEGGVGERDESLVRRNRLEPK